MIDLICDCLLWKKHTYSFYKEGSEEKLYVVQWYRPWQTPKRLEIEGYYCIVLDNIFDFDEEEE